MRHSLILILLAPAWAVGGVANPLPPEAIRLSTAQIRETFSGVHDVAAVQDSAGTTAVNTWHSDGSFVNRWQNAEHSGEVNGRWWARDDRRCIVITDGLPGREGVESCTPLYREGERYFSVNPDGSVHGIHRLSPLDNVLN